MRQLHIATSPCQTKIYAGHIMKNSRTWAGNRQEVTGEALVAVADFILARGGSTLLAVDGQPRYKLTLEELPPPTALERLEHVLETGKELPT